VARISGKADTGQDLVRLGEAIRRARADRGYSQEAFADACGLDRSHVGRIERGERNVTFLNIVRMATAMHLKPSDILKFADL